ncbi:MAG: hypothetical protein ACK5Q5_02950 [Planctomycetaceae bacterium]
MSHSSTTPLIDDAVSAGSTGARRLVLTFLTTAILGLLGVAGLNMLADPYGAFGVDLIPADSRTGDSRTARAEMLRRFTGETLLVGSSRTRVGYDAGLSFIPGGPACNLGLDGTHLSELVLVVQQAAANPHVRRIVLSLDMHLCDRRWQPNADFRCSRFNPDRSALEHECDLLWNGRSIEASFRAIRGALRGKANLHDERGFAVNAGRKFETASQATRTKAALKQLCGAEGLLAERQTDETTREQLAAMVSACRDRGIELIVVLDPVHALLLEGMRQRGDWPAYLDWKRDVVELATEQGATVWDFTGYTRWTTEPLLESEAANSRWFWEPSHMRRELGDLVLQRIFHDPAADASFGVELTSDRLPEQIATTELTRLDWLAGQRQETEALARLLQSQPTATTVQAADKSRSTRR